MQVGNRIRKVELQQRDGGVVEEGAKECLGPGQRLMCRLQVLRPGLDTTFEVLRQSL